MNSQMRFLKAWLKHGKSSSAAELRGGGGLRTDLGRELFLQQQRASELAWLDHHRPNSPPQHSIVICQTLREARRHTFGLSLTALSWGMTEP